MIQKRVFIVIAKIIENNPGAVSYILYDVDTFEVVIMTLREIKEAIKAGHDVKGFAGLNSKGLCSLRLNSYFIKIGTVGEKKDGKQYYAVVERRIYSEEKRFAIVDLDVKRFELKQSELINLMKGGAIVAGAKLGKNNNLSFSRRDIRTVLIK